MLENIKNLLSSLKKDHSLLLLVLLAFSLPFERIPSFDIVGITLRISTIIGALVILRAGWLVLKRKVIISNSLLYKLLIAFVVWIVILIFISINIERALQVVLFNVFCILLAVSVSLLFKKEYIKYIIYSLLISGVLMSIIALYQYFGDIFGLPAAVTGLAERYRSGLFGFPRVQATALEPLYFGSFMLIPTMLALSIFLLGQKQILPKRLTVVLLTLFTTIVFITVARSAIYAMILGYIVAISIALAKKLTAPRRVISSILVILASFILSYVVINYASKLPQELSKTFGKRGGEAFTQQILTTGLEGAGDERAQSRRKAIKILNENKQRYVLGIGPGQYGPYVANNDIEKNGISIVNNLTLELLLETGIIGLGIIIVFYLILVCRAYIGINNKPDKNEVSLLSLGLIAYLFTQAVQYQGFSTLYVTHLWFVTGLMMALVIYGTNNKKRR